MKVLEELFSTLKDFQTMVSGVDSSVDFSTLNSSAISANKQIVNILSADIYKRLLNGEGELKEMLQLAVGNLTMAKDVPFDVIRKRKADVDVYKYEMENMRRSYVDNYFNAMDSLISILESDEKDPVKWKDTPYCKLRENLKIKSTDEFNLLYPIDSSYLFFFRTIPIQNEILDDTMADYFVRAEKKEELARRLKRALAQLTVATAIRRFDLIELPATIRNLYEDNTSQRQASNEQSRLLELAADLAKSAMETMQNVDLTLSEPETNNIETETSFNRPEDKIYLMS